jgi:hypothetical protein
LAEPGASLFGLAIPAFTAVDRLMATTLAPLPRVILWGGLMAILSMLLYGLISPQQKLAQLRSETAAARQKLAGFDGEMSALWSLVGQSLKLSLRQILTIFVPAVIASLPLVSCLVWLDSTFGYRSPSAGQAVRVEVSPASEIIQALPTSALDQEVDGWEVHWPRSGSTIELRDRQAAGLTVLGAPPGSDVVERRQWWNALIGNPMGYLPEASPIDRLEFDFKSLELHGIGPAWLRGWEAPFFLSLIVLSILIKVLFRIE